MTTKARRKKHLRSRRASLRRIANSMEHPDPQAVLGAVMEGILATVTFGALEDSERV